MTKAAPPGLVTWAGRLTAHVFGRGMAYRSTTCRMMVRSSWRPWLVVM